MKLLIINRVQFGYLIDNYYFCKYANNDFEITYLGFYTGKPLKKINNINVKHVTYTKNKLKNYINFFSGIFKEMQKTNDVVFITYFPFVFIFRIFFPNKKIILDIRTGSVNRSIYKRKFQDKLLKFGTLFFKHITIISEGLAKKIGLKKYHLLPLGAERKDYSTKKFSTLRIIYIGTLNNRKIEDTIAGIELFLKNNPKWQNLEYIIIGDGYHEERNKLKKLVNDKNLETNIRLPGYIHHEELDEYLENANVGVSYIPIDERFNVQPPTKTYEYLLSGIVTIATDTDENRKVINKQNGVLIEDNPTSFAKGLEHIANNLDNYNPEEIKQNMKNFEWVNIIQNNLIPYIKSI